MSQEIMTPAHQHWRAFKKILAREVRAVGCDQDLAKARLMLARHFPDVNLQGSVEFFRKSGAYCDCEILFNL